jgi:hypothetical protein
MFSLYKLSTDKHYTSYAWINPDGVCFTSREIAPIGFQRSPDGFVDGLTSQQLKDHGFKKVSTKMTQDQLSKGWLF